MEGDFTLKVQGKLDRAMKADESFETPANTVHDACTTTGFKVLATYVVERKAARVTRTMIKPEPRKRLVNVGG